LFDTQVVFAHQHLEETVFTPVSTPGVSTDPVFSTIIFDTPTNDGDFVVDIDGVVLFTPDTTSVVLFESISSHDTATDGSVGIDSLLHVVDTADETVAGDLPMSVGGNGGAEEIVVLALRRRRGNAGLALLLGQAEFQSGVLGDVVLARFFGDTLVITELVDTDGFTTVAITTGLTVDDGLGTEGNLRISVVSQNVDSVSQRRGSTLSPARSAVNGDMLVLGPGEVVDTIGVSPIPGLGEVTSLDVAPGESFGLSGVLSELVSEFVVDLHASRRVLLFRSSEESFRLGLLGGVVLVTVGPGVSGNTPVAVSFDGKVVDTSDDSEETVLTPVSTPGVSDNPVLGTVGKSTPTNDGDIVIDFGLVSSINENTTSVVEKRASSNTADDGASLHDFAHHSFFTFNGAVFINTVDVVAIGNGAFFTGRAVSALDVISTCDTVVPTLSLIVGAGFVSDVVLMNVFISSGGITTVATLIGLFAGEEDLGSDVDIGPDSLSHDLDTIRHGGGGSEGPAGTTVLGNMLVSGNGEVVGTVDVVPGEVGGEGFQGEEGSFGLDKGFNILILDVTREGERDLGDVGEDEDSKSADEEGQAQECDERFVHQKINK